MSGAILFGGTPAHHLTIWPFRSCYGTSPMGMRNSPSATPVAEEVIELCRLLARNGHAGLAGRCLLLRVERTCRPSGATSVFDPYRSSSALRWRCGAVTSVVFFKSVFGVALSSEGRMRRRALIKLIAGSAVALQLDHRRHRSRRWRLEALNARRIKSQLETGESHVQET